MNTSSHIKRIGIPTARAFVSAALAFTLASCGGGGGGSTGNANSNPSPNAALVAELDSAIRSAIAAGQHAPDTGVGVAVIKNGQIVMTQGYGLRDRENGFPFDKDTIFAIGSTSKAFTGVSVAIAAEDGRLDMNAPIKNYLPTFAIADPVATQQMTAIDLLSHRSGLSVHDRLWYFRKVSRAEMFAAIPYLEDNPQVGFRQSFIYQNLMFMTAGVLVEAVTGGTWEDFVSARIFAPLGMTNSNITEAGLFNNPNHAVGYRYGARMPYYISCPAIAPAGCINSSAVDMAKWVQFHLDHGVSQSGARLLSQVGMENLYFPHNTIPEFPQASTNSTYGLGWGVYPFDGVRFVNHGGGLDGYSAEVSFIPELGMGVVVLVNEHGSALRFSLAKAIYEVLLRAEGRSSAPLAAFLDKSSGEIPAPQPFTPPSLVGATKTGTFRHPAYGDLETYSLAVPGTYAVKYYDNVWPARFVSGLDFMVTVPFAGVLQELPLRAESGGTKITGILFLLSDGVPHFTAVTS